MSVDKMTNLHGDLGLHGLTGAVENEREHGEEEEESENEGGEIASAGEATFAVVVVEEAFFFDDGAVLPGLVAALAVVAGGVVVGLDLLGSGLDGAGEAGGGGVAGVAADGGVGVGRGTGGAEDGGGLEGGGGLLAVVGVAGGALDVVDWAAGGSGWGRRGEACDLGVGLGVHFCVGLRRVCVFKGCFQLEFGDLGGV